MHVLTGVSFGLIWTVAVMPVMAGASFGFIWTSVVLVTRPFARRPIRARDVLLLVPAAIAITYVVASLIAQGYGSSIGITTAAASGIAGMYGAILLAHGRGGGMSSTATVLLDSEITRSKDAQDRWVLVVGPLGAGKSTLVEDMGLAAVAAPSRSTSGDWNTSGSVRLSSVWRGGNVTEIPIRRPSGEFVFRFWERDAIPDPNEQFPAFGEIDAVIVVADPTQLPGVGDSFPPALRTNATEPFDANTMLLDIANRAQQAKIEPRVWFAVSKPDLLRFSVDPRLVEFPIQLGHRWQQQAQTMQASSLRQLVDALGVPRALDVGNNFSWGAGSPLLVHSSTFRNYRNRGDADGGFGHLDLLDFLVSAL
jgi:hypothetical protein